MTNTLKRQTSRRGYRMRARGGAIILLLALMLPVVIILAAFAINIAYLELNRTEMYIASDAASRAAGREYMVTNDLASARAKGRDAAKRNLVGGKPVTLDDADMVFGSATRPSLDERYNFVAGGNLPNAVEVTVQKSAASTNGPIRLLIPNPFGGTTINSTQTSRTNQIEVDVALVIDRSGSMAYASNETAVFPPLPAAAPFGWFFNGPAPNPSRWRDAIAAVDAFLTTLEASPIDEAVSLVTYNDSVRIDQDLSNDYSGIRASLNFYTQFFTSGYTNIGGGIDGGHASFDTPNARPYAAKVMIVLTDGIDTVGSDPIGAAEDAAGEEIMIFTITFSDEADQATMEQVAAAGLGKHYHATNGTDLTAIFQDIARQLPILISR